MSATPILDLEQDPPAPHANRWGTLLGLAAGAAIGAGVRALGFDSDFLLLLPALYVAVAIHELGHLFAGQLAGMRPGGLVIGGFMMLKSGDRWVYRFDYRRILGGGLAKPLPPKGEFNPARYARMVAGGPLASLLMTALCGIMYLQYGSGANDWIGCLFGGAAIVTVTSLIPMSVGLNRSDGARLWLLLRHPERSRAWMALLIIMTEEASGVLPRDWESELVDQMLAGDPSDNEQPYRRLFAYYRSADERNESAALSHLETALVASAHAGKVVRQCLFLEASAACAAREDAGKAHIWRDRGLKLRKPETMDAVDAAIAICEGRYDDALPKITAARAYLNRRKLDSGLARFAKERLDEQEHLCRSKLTLAPAENPA